MRTETFEDLCSVVVKQREEIKALRDALKSHATCCWHDLARAQDAQLQKITRELDEAITEDRAAREDAVKRAEADRVRIERLREERDQFRAKLEAATGADHTVPAAVPQHGVIGKTVRHSTGRVGRVMSVKTDWVDGHGWTLYAVQRSDGVAGSQIWHASNCTIVEERPAKEPVPNATQWVEDMRGNTEASHDTPAGKEAAESVIRGGVVGKRDVRKVPQ